MSANDSNRQARRPVVVDTRMDLAAALSQTHGPRAVVMTMGGLHAGHGDLIRIARDLVGAQGHVTVTIFVNPLQFAATEDLSKYPRTFEADVQLCGERGADLIFAPTPNVIYPKGDPQITVDPGALGAEFEGVARPDHFRGVLTVVSILLQMTRPDFAIFGEKDFQQLTLVRRMVDDLALPVEIVPGPTAREASGLAMSSRNRYLSDSARETALRIPEAIAAGVDAGPLGADAVVGAARAILESPSAAVEVDVQYVVVTDPLMGTAPEMGEARLILTAIVDGTRLLDNAAVYLGTDGSAE